jgi:hypothetical protein
MSPKTLKYFIFPLLSVFVMPQFALGFKLPNGLDSADRNTVVNDLGIPTSTKVLSNPYPLGGYSGVELGVSYLSLNTRDISLLGNKTQENEDTLSLVEFSFGKGLYNDVDLFFSFAPFNQSDNINSYGGILRWCFYKAENVPLSFSVAAMGNVFHVTDSYVHQNVSLNLISGVNVENISLFFGLGQVQGEGRFMGGDSGVIAGGGESVKEQSSQQVLFIGLNIEFENIFISAQLDKYSEAVLSAKLGTRF